MCYKTKIPIRYICICGTEHHIYHERFLIYNRCCQRWYLIEDDKIRLITEIVDSEKINMKEEQKLIKIL